MKRLLLAAAALVCTGAFAQQNGASPSGVLSAQGGRYVFGQISTYRRDQYMLDTQTGRLWQIVQSKYKKEDGTEDTFEILQAVPYEQKNLFTVPPPLAK